METDVSSVFIIVILIIIVLMILAFLNWPFFYSKKHEQHYFVADQLVFQITHKPGKTQAEIAQAVRDFLRPPRNASQQASVKDGSRVDRSWKNKLQPPPLNDPRMITFPTQNEQALSLVPVSLVPLSIFRLSGHRKRDLRRNDVIQVLKGAYNELSEKTPFITDPDIQLDSIYPNWLTSNLHHGQGTGGPGSWPISETSVPNTIRPAQGVQGVSTETTSRTVNVAILDTAPVSTTDESTIRGLIPRLQPVIYDGSSPGNSQRLNVLKPYTPEREHIQMPDHGTFIAGIVDSVAQGTATIYLYEVLNSFGVGSFTIIAQGLQRAIRELYDLDPNKTDLIINCSFMFRVPSGEQLEPDLDRRMIDVSNQSMRQVFAEATNGRPNITIIAAAGNDATLENGKPSRPSACYPAAFKNVIGVGALPNQNYIPNSDGEYEAASYSNLSFSKDEGKSPTDGYMTFGGELANPGATSGTPFPSDGLVGVYVGPISTRRPNGEIDSRTNQTTSARWAGTSFAAPIIVGLRARNGVMPNSSDRTDRGEIVIKVTQP
jgi:hypothetical protein